MVAFSAGLLILLVQKSFIRLSPSTSTFLVVVVVVFDQPGRKENDVIISFYSNHSAFWSIAGQSTNIPDYSMHSYSRIRSIERTFSKGDPIMSSLRKQPTFCDATTDFFVK